MKRCNDYIKYKNALQLSIFVLISVIVIVLFVNIFNNKSKSIFTFDKDFVLDINENWELSYEEDNKVEKKIVDLPQMLGYEKDREYTLCRKLDKAKNIEKGSLCFVTNFGQFEVFIDDVLIKSFVDVNASNSNEASKRIYIIDLPNNYSGKELKIKLNMESNSLINYSIKSSYIGEETLAIRVLISSEKFKLIVSLILLFFIIVSLYYCVILHKRFIKSGGIELFCSLSFAIAALLYIFSDSNLAIFMINNPYFLNCIKYISLSFMPIPMILIVIQKSNYKRCLDLIFTIFLAVINSFIQIILSQFELVEFRKMLFATHIVICLVAISSIRYYVVNRKKLIRGQKKYMYSILAMALGSIIDVISYRTKMISYEGLIFQLTTLYFMINLLVDIKDIYNEIYKKSLKSNVYKVIAYTDVMTKLGNRVAYEEQIRNLNSNINKYKFLGCVSIDTNNLKCVNDSLGHYAGDEIIIRSAEILKEIFKYNCSVFRVGGDEFMVFVYGKTGDELEQLINNLRFKVRMNNKFDRVKVSLAIGYGIFNKDIDENIEGLIRRTDRYMYEDKRKIKEI